MSYLYPAITACQYSCVLPYAAYLRVYEPLSAFPEAEGQRWADYAASPGRPRRAGALAAEQAESLLRAIAVPSLPAPERRGRPGEAA